MSPEILLAVIKGMVWLMAILLGIIGFLLVREFSEKDKIRTGQENLASRVSTSVEALNEAVAGLTLAIEEIRMWSVDRFVHQTVYDREIKEVKGLIRTNAEQARKDRNECEARCRMDRE